MNTRRPRPHPPVPLNDHPWMLDILQSVPGITVALANTLLADIPDPRSFTSRAAFLRACGIHPSTKPRFIWRPKRARHRRLFRAFYWAVTGAIATDTMVAFHYSRCLRELHDPILALNATAVLLARLTWLVAKSAAAPDPFFPPLTTPAAESPLSQPAPSTSFA